VVSLTEAGETVSKVNGASAACVDTAALAIPNSVAQVVNKCEKRMIRVSLRGVARLVCP
jgi:hypothetical protein